MRAAIFTDVFPRLSNTFVINQMTGLIDRGVAIDIFTRALGDVAGAHRPVAEYRLDERLVHLPVPRPIPTRVADAALRLLRAGSWRAAALASIDPRRNGREGLALVHLYTALAFLPQPRYDVVHAQFAKLGPELLRLIEARRYREPLLVSVRGADLTRHLQRNPRLYDSLFSKARLFLPVSESLADLLREAGCPGDRIEVHHSGIDLERFSFRPRTRAKGEPTRLLFIGRLTEKKGLRYGLEALARLTGSGRAIELAVVGEGEESESLRELASRLGLDDRVRWLGRMDHSGVTVQLERSHALIAPSVTAEDGDQEGIPNVLKEAMACGMPVVSTYHSGIPELVEDGRSGLLAPERDAEALADRLSWLVDHADCWPALGAAGRRKVEAEYDSRRLNDRLADIYRQVASEPATA